MHITSAKRTNVQIEESRHRNFRENKPREFKFLFQPRSDKENENLNLISDKQNGKVSYPVLVTESN